VFCHPLTVRATVLPVLAAAAAALGLAAGAPAAAPRATHWLSWDRAGRTARLLLVASDGGANNGFNFDGYGRGKLLVRIPVGWRVTVTCRNAGTLRNSCAVVHDAGTATPAFPGAATPSPIVGLQPGKTARFTFIAARVGVYRIASLVPGHEEARMWDVLEIGLGGVPSISVRTGF
jgi:Sulfocyanin (SoxE) domain